MKAVLRGLFATTLAELEPGRALAPALTFLRGRAAAGDRFLVLAYGKAARAMTTAVVTQLPGARWRGLVVPPEPDQAPLPPFEVIAGGHPLPTAGSLAAGARALALAHAAEPDETVLFLASGGGSAMLEQPLVPGVTLDELRSFHQALVGSGASILAMNAIRQRISAVKGGRLAMAAARAREQLTLTVSDVFRGFAGCVASGPSTAELDWQHGRRALDERQLWAAVPAALREPLRADTLPRGLRGPLPTPPTRFADVLDNRAAGLTMMAAARRAGLGPARFLDVDELDQDDQTAPGLAGRAVAALDRLRRRWPGRRVAVVTGGELSVPLPANPGIGGRNQQFVLECARLIRGRPITVLSGGTDGIDGNSTAAGGLADGHTMARARARGCDVHRALRDCDAFPLLQALGDTVVTGPTGTNVRDLRVLVHHD